MKNNEIGDRIRLLMGNDSPADFAQKVGVTERSLHNYLSGQMPRLTVRTKICDAYNINPMWLFQGRGPMYACDKMDDVSPILKSAHSQHTDFIDSDKSTMGDVSPIWNRRQSALCGASPDGIQTIYVPKVEARLSAGTGSFEVSDNIKGYFGFRSDWLRRKGCPSQMVLMTVTGDSMRPTLENGDMALIYLAQTEVIAGGIYAVGLEDSVVVKRLERLPGKLVLVSDNRSAYAPRELDMTDESVNNSVRIIGRVLWWCREA